MGTYLKMWMPSRHVNDKKLITIDSIWDLGSKDIEFRGSTSSLLNVILEYNVIAGNNQEIYPIKGGAYLNVDYPSLPANHKIYIRAYENNEPVDEESIDTSKTPIN